MITIELTKQQYDLFTALWEAARTANTIQGQSVDFYTLKSDSLCKHCKTKSKFIGLQEFGDDCYKMYQCLKCQTTFINDNSK